MKNRLLNSSRVQAMRVAIRVTVRDVRRVRVSTSKLAPTIRGVTTAIRTRMKVDSGLRASVPVCRAIPSAAAIILVTTIINKEAIVLVRSMASRKESLASRVVVTSLVSHRASMVSLVVAIVPVLSMVSRMESSASRAMATSLVSHRASMVSLVVAIVRVRSMVSRVVISPVVATSPVAPISMTESMASRVVATSLVSKAAMASSAAVSIRSAVPTIPMPSTA